MATSDFMRTFASAFGWPQAVLYGADKPKCHPFGMWRSWLAYASGGRVVASSSLVIPTQYNSRNVIKPDIATVFLIYTALSQQTAYRHKT